MCAPPGSLAWRSHRDTHLASPECLAAGQGVAGAWEGAGSGGGVLIRPGLPLTRGRAQKAQQMGATHVS